MYVHMAGFSCCSDRTLLFPLVSESGFAPLVLLLLMNVPRVGTRVLRLPPKRALFVLSARAQYALSLGAAAHRERCGSQAPRSKWNRTYTGRLLRDTFGTFSDALDSLLDAVRACRDRVLAANRLALQRARGIRQPGMGFSRDRIPLWGQDTPRRRPLRSSLRRQMSRRRMLRIGSARTRSR